jgi:hydrogenase expression/formation protein HypD
MRLGIPGEIIELRTGQRAGTTKFMEVCGGHTHTIYKHGLEDYLPENITLVHGPGCPVCVIPMGRVDDAIHIASQPDVIMTSFGDMMRVSGGNGSFLDANAAGADIRMVYSPLDALKIARDNPRPVHLPARPCGPSSVARAGLRIAARPGRRAVS